MVLIVPSLIILNLLKPTDHGACQAVLQTIDCKKGRWLFSSFVYSFFKLYKTGFVLFLELSTSNNISSFGAYPFLFQQDCGSSWPFVLNEAAR